MEKLKVSFLSSGLMHKRGGAAISEASLCAELNKLCDLKILVRKGMWEPSFTETFHLSNIIEFESREMRGLEERGDSALSDAVYQSQICHINGHWRLENYYLSQFCIRERIPYVIHPRGMLWVGHRKILLKKIFNLLFGNFIMKHSSAVIALSQFEIHQWKNLPIEQIKIRVVPNGITMPDLAEIKKIKLPLPQKYFLYLGRLEERKNLLFLIRAHLKYLERGGKTLLLLVGPSEHSYDKELKIIAEKAKGRIVILPPVFDDTKWVYLSHAKAVIYPTIEEPFGRVVFEAISSKTFPIIPDHSGGNEYLLPFKMNLSYSSGQLDSLVELMERAESLSSLKHPGLEKAYRWVKKELDWGFVSEKVVSIYTSITSPRQKHKIAL